MGQGVRVVTLEDGSASYERGCASKARYFTLGEAKKIAKKITKRTGKKMWVYECAHCFGGAHVTSKPPDRLSSDRHTPA